MKPFIALLILVVVLSILVAGCGSAATFTEKYEQTPAMAKSTLSSHDVSQGISTYNFTFRGEKWIVVKGNDAKFHVIGKEQKYE
jgi:hypothetical protein